ncbi:OsmC family protein [Thermorudis peleae]|uniref:OsmC family protein n=1 Tax=Thermorudis peleae TaxID=1382356 RepID=UPI00056F6FE3|nr:OsmC family protein [Thermorudis peleae]
MPVRTATAVWQGAVPGGTGQMEAGSRAFSVPFSFGTRFGNDPGTNPEELIGAAHAGCFSMALAFALTQAGHTPERIQTTAQVQIDQVEGGFRITRIALETEGKVPGIDEATFQRFAEQAKNGCPVSQALRGVSEVTLNARLVN